MCEQEYHGVVACALGWACWKTYLGRPEGDWNRGAAINQLGNGLSEAKCHEDALSVKQVELSLLQRLGSPMEHMLITKGNLALTYKQLGRHEDALILNRDVYLGCLKLLGKQHKETLREGNNYAVALLIADRFAETKSLMRKIIPVARRVLDEDNHLLLMMRWVYARALYRDPATSLNDLREAMSKLEEMARTARRVLGGAHPDVVGIEESLRDARKVLRARETPPQNAVDAS